MFDARDGWHGLVLAWLREHPRVRLVTTWSVLTEVTALLARPGAQRRLRSTSLRWVDRGAVSLDVPGAGSLREALETAERSADLPFDLADASIAEAAGRLRIDHVLSIDRDFVVYRDKAGRRLINPLLDD